MTESPSISRQSELVLYQFAFSHFNEKARWGLDWKALPSKRRNLLPGFHTRRTRSLGGGTETPILEIDGEAVAGSTSILRRLEAICPTPELFPDNDAERDEVDDWIVWLDDEVGPAIRLGLFDEILKDPAYAVQIFAVGQPGWKRRGYAMIFPKIIQVLRNRMSITTESAAAANETTARALDRIASAVESTGYLVGDRFTAADLTAASLLFPLSFPPELPFSMPVPTSAAAEQWESRWAGRAGVLWMEELYRAHR
jgi:glutathione S-transferase